MFVANHILGSHPEWKEELSFQIEDLSASKSSSTSNPTESVEFASSSSSSPMESTNSPFTNPDWLQKLKKSLKADIIDKCALNVREAIGGNKTIEDIRERRQIRNNIINTVVGQIVVIFGGIARPGIGDVRKIVTELQFIYPAMFKEEGVGSGYGFGGTKGVDGLANQMLDRIRDRDSGGAKKPGEKTVGNDGIETPKRVKRKLIFGNIRHKNFCK